MKYVRSTGKVFVCIAAAFVCLIILIEASLAVASRSESVKRKIESLIAADTGSRVEIGKIRASLLGIRLKDIKLGDDKANIFSVGEIKISFEPFALLAGKLRVAYIEIKGFNADIVKNEDGSFNFESLFAKTPDTATQDEQSASSADNDEESNRVNLPLLLRRASIKDSRIKYTDNQQNIQLEINDIFFDIRKFTLDNPFEAAFNCNIFYKDKSYDIKNLGFGISTLVNLNAMDLDNAYLKIKLLAVKFGNTFFDLKGTISDFNNPRIELTSKLSNLSDKTFADIMALPIFAIPQINTDLYAKLDLKNNIFTVNKLSFNALSSSFNADGRVGLENPAEDYNFNIDGSAALQPLGDAVDILAAYKPVGSVNLKAQVNPKDIIKADVLLADIGALVPQAGDLTRLNSQIKVNGLKNISMPYLKAKLNGLPFSAKASYTEYKDKADVKFDFKAAHLLFKDTPDFLYKPKTDTTTVGQEAGQPAVMQKEESSLPPLDIKGQIKIGTLDSQYFKGDKFSFDADMQNITAKLDHAAGAIQFSMVDGQIKDLYKLADMNSLTKVMFLSLVVVSKVINSLNVLEILGNISDAVINGKQAPVDDSAAFAGEEPKTQQEAAADSLEPAAQTHLAQRKLDGQMDFIKLTANLDFKDGINTIKQTNFVSDLLSFKIKGKNDFKKNKLDMTVNTAPGRHEDDGIMPLTLNIGGTLQEPKGSISMLGSIAQLLLQTAANNAASDLLKKGVSAAAGAVISDDDNNAKGEAKPADADIVQEQAPAADQAQGVEQPAQAQDSVKREETLAEAVIAAEEVAPVL